MTLTLRAATPLDAGAVGAILHGFNRDTVWMPKLYSEAETISFAGVMIDRGWVRVAERETVIGFIARDGAEICSLYLSPDAQGQGIGVQLLEEAKAQSSVLELWAFEANEDARRFYIREGFQEVARSDGARNEEGLPDVRLRWQRGVAA
ncbi:putative N-acetyltransferase YjaB [Thalassovita autumnalis]|uniref:N-acetyltransferase YjaB n=1 Tax=Thalassovita autumnalis TaxID=2072972 RepID=A0A0P1FRD0_9RHOB|nr:GNAT family N-acetyltransferase [Thalassovita autumnalis]CUH67947.1 putative N-acetyltransferase YjaB [Thalassovita autumnalis]CUH70849.1 putative N-acetyltransferase YjaB [Thalassovita autumnalis]